MARKKVLIITYYWPPSGGSGVQRWVKFTKYLRDFGWEPVIYTPSNPEFPAIDQSLVNDIPTDVTILKQPISEPYALYKKIVGLKPDEQLGAGLMQTGKEKSFLKNVSIWIRGNIFIPDARRFWIRPSVRFLKEYLRQHKMDAMVSTGPPHSMHLIAKKVAQKTNIPWLADFRDPWTNIDFFEDLKPSALARWIHHKLEASVLKAAHRIVVVSPTMQEEFREITSTPVALITNGYDSEDFTPTPYIRNEVFTMVHVGMMTASRNPEILWEVLSELKNEVSGFGKKFKLHLIGKTDSAVIQTVNLFKLNDVVEFTDYIPHSEIVRIQQQTEVLLLIINNTPNAALILTGKMFEYLAARRPIICISPVLGDTHAILENSGAGKVILYNEKDTLKNEILRAFRDWESGKNIHLDFKSGHYSRRALTGKLADELNNITP